MPTLSYDIEYECSSCGKPNSQELRGLSKFFYVGLSHDSLVNYYRTNFAMIQHHNWSLTELDQMMPWEREIYVTLLGEWVKEENERVKKEQRRQ